MPHITIPTKDGESFKAYVSMPETTPAPAIIVIQEIFGINHVMRDICHWLSGQGYIAVCPDLFWRIEPGIELTDKTEEEWAKAFDLFGKFDVDKGAEDISAVKHTMRGHADCTGKVGAIGYCLGGKMAYLASARAGVDASVGYYGVGIGDLLNESDNIETPLMLHIAEEDEYVPKDEQEAVKKKLDGKSHIHVFSYPGMDHAFAREGGQHYNKDAADMANQRSLDFLKDALC